jgi:hypothetical protein
VVGHINASERCEARDIGGRERRHEASLVRELGARPRSSR